LNIGATRFIQKPVDLDKLLATIADLTKQAAPVALEPLNEFNFYDGYRKRLEAKLDEKNKQIARDEILLGIQSNEGDQFILASLRRARNEREELKLLLDQVQKQLEKYTKRSKTGI
jgi:DNA-binding response OmpR family regulator